MSTDIVEELKSKTVLELKSYAKKNKINLDGVTTKNDILEIIVNFIPKDPVDEKPKDEKTKNEKVAVYASRNIHWQKVGVLEKGYNIVTKEASEKWLTHKAVRIATPAEVAKYYGK